MKLKFYVCEIGDKENISVVNLNIKIDDAEGIFYQNIKIPVRISVFHLNFDIMMVKLQHFHETQENEKYICSNDKLIDSEYRKDLLFGC